MARSTLEDFDVECQIGSGTFGSVFRAKRKADGRTYALKEVDMRCMKAQEQEDCIKETQLLASLDSGYIIKFYDSFLQKGKLYICMEYAPGGNLYDYLRRQQARLPEAEIWRLFLQMLLGLNYMHARKVLHRDFKTLNVFLDERLNVRLGDLGVAKALSADTAFAQTMIGTPYYMSPEMCEDRPYNEKSDVWALGVGLYECCTHRHPFDAENQGSLILKILRGKYPAVTGYSRDLTELVKACLTLDADRRLDTIGLLALRAVREHASDLGLELPPLPASELPPGRALASLPSRRGIASGRSFTSLRARAQPPAAPEGQQQQQQQQPAAVMPNVVVLQPPALPQVAPASSRSSPTPPFGRSPSMRVASRRALNAAAGGEAAAAAGAQGDPAGALGALVVGPAVVGSRPAGAGKRLSLTDEAPGVPGSSGLEALQGLRIAAAPRSPRPEHAAQGDGDAAAGASSAAAPADAAPPAEPAQVDAAGAAAAGGLRPAMAPDGDHQSSNRSVTMQRALPVVKSQLIELVGPLAFDALRAIFTAAAQGGPAGDASGEPPEQQAAQQQLWAAVHSVVPPSQAPAVVPLLVKMAYLESQLEQQADSPPE